MSDEVERLKQQIKEVHIEKQKLACEWEIYAQDLRAHYEKQILEIQNQHDLKMKKSEIDFAYMEETLRTKIEILKDNISHDKNTYEAEASILKRTNEKNEVVSRYQNALLKDLKILLEEKSAESDEYKQALQSSPDETIAILQNKILQTENELTKVQEQNLALHNKVFELKTQNSQHETAGKEVDNR